ncbi:MAG: hypothetical protein EA376_14510 [Phycisphaeraceae bacterium]|nr:MAG: hypothetical protein EA376_14510 [Phycisphaeraceae bacterium]
MQNRFGLKDFVLLTLLIVVGISVWLGMVQEDRRWDRVQSVARQVDRLEQQIARMHQSIEEGIAFAPAPGDPGSQGRAAGERDESWARDGVEIQWQAPLSYVHDPREMEGYRLGGSFTEIFEAQPPTITPMIYRDVYGGRIRDVVVEGLGRYNPKTLELEGVLAEAWQYDPDGRWLRVKIHPRARFSDGEPVKAEDVKFSHDLFYNMEIEADRFRSLYDMITNITVVSEKVVEFEFDDPTFLNLDRALEMPVFPKHFYEQFTPSQINQSTGLVLGSGPFRVRDLHVDEQWTPGQDIVLVRNEQYWAGARPALDQLRFRVVTDDLARLTAFNNREGDMMRANERQHVRMSERDGWLDENQALKWYNIRSGYSFIAWNTGTNAGRQTPFNDARVRRAMTMLLDREHLIRTVYEGIGEVCTGPFHPTTPQSDPSVEPWPYDMDEARRLLAEAGWTPDGSGVLRNERGDSFRFSFTYSPGQEATQRIANYLRDQCARVGIRCDLNVVDWSVYADILHNREFDAITLAWSPTMPEQDPYQLWHSDSIARGGDNFVQWNSPTADRLIEQGRRELDREKRQQIWHELHRHIHEEQPYTFMFNRPWLRFVNGKFQNVHTYPTGLEQREFFIGGGPLARPN